MFKWKCFQPMMDNENIAYFLRPPKSWYKLGYITGIRLQEIAPQLTEEILETYAEHNLLWPLSSDRAEAYKAGVRESYHSKPYQENVFMQQVSENSGENQKWKPLPGDWIEINASDTHNSGIEVKKVFGSRV